MRWAGAWALSVKPAIGLALAFSNPGCLAGSNASGVPHVLPSLMALVMLAGGWRLWVERNIFFRLFGWSFLIGASMFSSVPLLLAVPGLRALVLATIFAEWPSLVGILAALSVRLFTAMESTSATFRRVSMFGIVVFSVTILAPLVGAISPLYVLTVAIFSYAGLPALLILLWRLIQRLEMP